MRKSSKPEIAITMGDPGGIGPEIALRAAASHAIRRISAPVVVGDIDYLDALAGELGFEVVPDCGIRPRGGGGTGGRPEIRVADSGGIARKVALGKPSLQGGRAAGGAIERAVELALSGAAHGIVTAPVSKESLALAGYGMIGHTELLAGLTGTRLYAMMLARKGLRVIFATTHVPISGVARRLKRKDLVDKFSLGSRYLKIYMGIREPKMGVCCLNPHCGEGGMLSREEKKTIIPAIKSARRKGINVDGPYPADSIFGKNLAPGFDAVIAMYHDQGMIPLKMVRQEEVVNITLGLPIVRTSPGHGTAFDIAGCRTARRRIADCRGMVSAARECARIAKRMKHAG
ncbi:MAG: 4-hydroxythreonine-4-phosphate dehydrogenase PdxA [bacterium]